MKDLYVDIGSTNIKWQKNGEKICSFTPVGTPLVGGTVIPLDKQDGSILQPYIYYCKSEYEYI